MSDPTVPAELRRTLTPASRPRPTEMRVGRGRLARLPSLLAAHAPAHAYAVVSDDTVAELYGGPVRDAIRASGSPAEQLRFPAGESSKTAERWRALVEELGAMGLGRDGCVVAVGGGVTGDLAGFAAATYARGVTLVQVPTSLLAMIDASLGGKTGIDLRAGKNLAGAFHDPALVVADPGVLDTLPAAELRTGLAEAVKHGAIADPSYFHQLTESADAVLALEPAVVDRVVTGSIDIKAAIVERDARESGERAMLNFGHTIAHGVEWATGYAVPHGQAVAMGLVAEAVIGERAGLTEAGTADALRRTLSALGLPVRIPRDVDPAAVVEAASSDKKAREGQVRYALVARIGVPARGADGQWTHAIPDAAAKTALVDLAGDSGGADEV